MIDRQQLLRDLQRLLPQLERDILAYSEAHTPLGEHLDQEYQRARAAERTAEHFVDWRAAQITQGAAAWILTCVFVRFLEDNALLTEPLLAGTAVGGSQSRLQQARDRIGVYFHEHPTQAERDYLYAVFADLERLPAMGELLDRSHNPLWRLPLSADGARALIDFFQRLDPDSGELIHDFTDPAWDTRFLGDLYQDLSAAVRKRYALLQTPEFVEAFILDHTLEPAKVAFGLPGLRLIDPTCGSGHFLLTAFERLFDDWQRRAPATNARALAQQALDAIHGVDINPYAVAIARFRLLIAAMRAAGSTRLQDAPDFHFNLAVGDSLLHGPRHEWQGQGLQHDMLDDGLSHLFEVEDGAKLSKILGQRYHVVVGNPPYIVVRDKALNQAYRHKYPTCHRQYSLGVPFTERFFDLTAPAQDNHPAGFVGMITANSFMKREFGKKLIEAFLPTKALTHVIDTSGAYIPGHGTPTVVLFARNRAPQGEPIRAVLGIRGEPETPDDAAQGRVWRSIVDLLEHPGSDNEFVSVVEQERGLYAKHPWSVGGGGATELKALLDFESSSLLDLLINEIGFGAVTREDQVYAIGTRSCQRFGIDRQHTRPLVEGEWNRDWSINNPDGAIWPYDEEYLTASANKHILRYLWPFRVQLSGRTAFGKTQLGRGLAWYEYSMFFDKRYQVPLSITFAFVATHNHFVLDRGGKVFNRSAPVIKLPAGATEADHLALLGRLNSSTACFWMKQVFHNKGNGGIGGGIGDENWEPRYEHDGTKLKSFPVAADPDHQAQALATTLDRLAQELAAQDPARILAANPPSPADALAAAEAQDQELWQRMIAWQEELDWLNYRLYGLTDDDLCAPVEPPPLRLGERPFEIALARRIAAGETETTWFQRHASTPATQIPAHWPDDYRALTERRLQAIEHNRWITLIEQPEYKRRWNREPWAKRQQRALHDWLLDSLETACPRDGLLTCAQLAERARRAARFQPIATLYTGSDTFDAQALVVELVDGDNVPQMAAARYKPAAMPKFRAWQQTWALQRAEDAIDARAGVGVDRTEFLPDGTVVGRSTPTPELTTEQAAELKAREVGDIPLPPQMAAARYKPAAMPKFRAWQQTWDKQRAEDAIDALIDGGVGVDRAHAGVGVDRVESAPNGTAVGRSTPTPELGLPGLTTEQAAELKAREVGDIPLPPKYASGDFRKSRYWGLRGKLDVPKERFFSLPYCERPGDNTLVIGWAGLNHLQRAQAIAPWYLDRKEQDGWTAAQLLPMLVAFDELIPWLKQWHNDMDAEFGERMGDYFDAFLLEELRTLGLSRDELAAWEPPSTTRGRRRKG